MNTSTSHTKDQLLKHENPDSVHEVDAKKISWFEKLKQKWKVTGTQLVLILCVFAITGTTTAYITRKITTWIDLDSSEVMYWVMKLVILIFGYQVLILLFSIPFGQFNFFWNFEKKLLRRFRFGKKRQKAIDKNPAA